MKLAVVQSDYFLADLQQQADWYAEHAGTSIAIGYVDAVQATLQQLVRVPDIGRVRFQKWPELRGIRSLAVRKPYQRHLIFYRFQGDTLFVERVIHGARDLPRRILQTEE